MSDLTKTAAKMARNWRGCPGHGQTIGVFGGTGHTGRFVVAELLKRRITPIVIGRDSAKLAALGFEDRGIEIRTAWTEDTRTLDRALGGAAAVINCAGPFLDTAEAVTAAALRARIHYLDVTAEQPSAQATFERCDFAAREVGVIVVPAMGFYGGFADLLVTATVGEWVSVDDVRVGIALDRWWPTRGTRITGQRNTARRSVIVDGELAPLPHPAPEMSWNFPEPFGRQDVTELSFSEIVVIARHLRVLHLHTYLNHAPIRDIRDFATPPPAPADDTGRSAQTFLVEVIARNGKKNRRAIARGRDIYAFTAPLVVEAAQRILNGQVAKRGALAPGEMFDATNFLQALVPDHLRFEIGSA